MCLQHFAKVANAGLLDLVLTSTSRLCIREAFFSTFLLLSTLASRPASSLLGSYYLDLLRRRQQLQQRPKVGLWSLSALHKGAGDSGHQQESVSVVGVCICFHGENLKGCPRSSHRVRTTSFAYSE